MKMRMKMERQIRKGPHRLYKGQYFIAFYDKTGEEFMYSFDNVREIVKFQGKLLTRTNINLVNVELYRALKSEEHFVRFLTGEIMRVYIIDIEGE